MEYKDFVFAACLQYAEKTTRLVPYLAPEALPTLQHLATELQRRHRDLRAMLTLLQEIRTALPVSDPISEAEGDVDPLLPPRRVNSPL